MLTRHLATLFLISPALALAVDLPQARAIANGESLLDFANVSKTETIGETLQAQRNYKFEAFPYPIINTSVLQLDTNSPPTTAYSEGRLDYYFRINSPDDTTVNVSIEAAGFSSISDLYLPTDQGTIRRSGAASVLTIWEEGFSPILLWGSCIGGLIVGYCTLPLHAPEVGWYFNHNDPSINSFAWSEQKVISLATNRTYVVDMYSMSAINATGGQTLSARSMVDPIISISADNPDGQFQLEFSANVATPVPEPSGLILGLCGAPLVGLFGSTRRRNRGKR